MRMLLLFLIGLTFGGAGGFVIAAANGFTLDGHDHADPAHHGSADHVAMNPNADNHAVMHDSPRDLDAATAPSLAIEVTPDSVEGFNLHVMTDRFEYAPRAAGGNHVDGQGHAHVYINGIKLGRLYAPWMHLDGLPTGDVDIAVTLNANDHRPLAIAGEPISATKTVTVE